MIVSPTLRLRHLFDLRGDETDLARAKRIEQLDLGPERAHAVNQMLRALGRS